MQIHDTDIILMFFNLNKASKKFVVTVEIFEEKLILLFLIIGNSSKKTKVNLLTCFLTFLHFCIDEDEPEVKYWLEDIGTDESEIDSKSSNSLQMFRAKLLNGDFSEQLLKIFSEDATSATGIWKVGHIFIQLLKKVFDSIYDAS